MSEIVIRVAGSGDAEAIAECHTATWKTAYRGLLPDAMLDEMQTADRIPRWIRTLADSQSGVYVALSDSTVVGFVALIPCRDASAGNAGELDAIYILESFAGQGIGGRFVAIADEWMRDNGFDRSILWVLPSNEPARRFYERYGWRADGAAKELNTPRGPVPAVRYVKELASSQSQAGS